MTDNFEKAMSDIAINSAANGGPTIQDVLTALVAKNDDDDDRSAELRKEASEAKSIAATLASVAAATAAALASDNEADHQTIIKALDRHLVQADDFFGRVAKLEAYKENTECTCEGRVKKLITEEHKLVHDAHMHELHPATPVYQSGMSPLGRDYADPSDSQFGEHRESAFPEDTEMGDIRRFWKTFKWVLIVFAGGLLVMLADQLGNLLFGGPT
jgi:hypothetical protein